MKTLDELKKEARAKVDALNLDHYVRQSAMSGKADEARINYYQTIVYDSPNGMALSVSATSGAGMNSASVWIEDAGKKTECVYKNNGLGNDLVTFREGFWIDIIIETGKLFEEKRKADEEEEKTKKELEQRKLFLPL